MSLSLITAAEAFAKAIKQVDHAINYFEQRDMLDEVINATKKGLVKLENDDDDFYLLVSTLDDMKEESVGHKIIWGAEGSDNPLIEAVFWIQGEIDGEPTVFVVAGYAGSADSTLQ